MTERAREHEAGTDVAEDEPAPSGPATGAAPVNDDAPVVEDALLAEDAPVNDDAVTDVSEDETATSGPDDAAAPTEEGDADPRHATFVVVEVVDVSFELPSPSPIVHLLEEAAPFRSLYFPVGLPEAQSIALAIAGEQAPRPTTHDLLVSVLAAAGCDVVAVRITGERGGTILAELDLMGPRGREVVDCRPTDGIAIALRLSVPAPILCEAGLLDR